MLAGLLGALTGLGGGVVIVPVLTLLFHVDIHYAIGASLVSVIATSSGAAAAYVREGIEYSHWHVPGNCNDFGRGAGRVSDDEMTTHAIGLIFGLVLLYSAFASLRKKRAHAANARNDALADGCGCAGVFRA